jgi:thiamine kinase-like enzyme
LPAQEDKLENLTIQTQDVYNLRRGRILVKEIIPETKYETLTFKHFFPKLLNTFKHFDFFVKKDSFKTQINLNLNQESIDISMKIVDQMAKMHAQFWGSDLKTQFPELKTTIDPIFSPFLPNFIKERSDVFKNRWKSTITEQQMILYDKAIESFVDIQERFSQGSQLTFIHGDIKSRNIFYDSEHNPYFIDWQHCGIGKGVQDLLFFIIESFDISQIPSVYPLLKEYYYKKLVDYGITEYSIDEYERDLYDALCYIPLFTSVWFGTVPQEELIDKDFPFLFMNKMFYLMEIILC